MREKNIPSLNPIARYFLIRFKNRLLDLPLTRETSALVDCIDFLLEAGRGDNHA